MFPFLLEAVCFDSIHKLSMVTLNNQPPSIIVINGYRCVLDDDAINTTIDILDYFTSKTKNLKHIEFDLKLNQFTRKHSISFNLMLDVVLKNGRKNNWKLTRLLFICDKLTITIREYLKFSENTLEELFLSTWTFHPITWFLSSGPGTVSVIVKKFPLPEIGDCTKLRLLDTGKRTIWTDFYSSTSLKTSPCTPPIENLTLHIVNITVLDSILCYLCETLQKINFTTWYEDISLCELINKINEKDIPSQELRQLHSMSWGQFDLFDNVDVRKLFLRFPKLESLAIFHYFNEEIYYKFAKDFLDLFHQHSSKRNFSIRSAVYRGKGLNTIKDRLNETFQQCYHWEFVVDFTTQRIEVWRGNARIMLCCSIWDP